MSGQEPWWGGGGQQQGEEAGAPEMLSKAFPYGSSSTAVIPHSEMAPSSTGVQGYCK